MFYQANPNSTAAPWSPPWAPAYWGHAMSPDLVHWTEVRASAIRGGSGSVVVLPERMMRATAGIVAVAIGGDGQLWTSRDADELDWTPPRGCTDAGPPTGKVTCNTSAMDPDRIGPHLFPPGLDAGTSLGDPTAAWVNATDGRIYSVQASLRCPRFANGSVDQTCTYKAVGGRYQALLFRTVDNLDPHRWEFVSVVWRAPPNEFNPHMGFTNCPDFFPLDDGRWVFAYLTHADAYSPTRVLAFTGTCDAAWNCTWSGPVATLDASSAFIASQSFTDAGGRCVLFGWVQACPPGAWFCGAQSVPRLVVADPGGPLRTIPLPELALLRTGTTPKAALNATVVAAGTSMSVASNTTNSFHFDILFDVSALSALGRGGGGSNSAANNASVTVWVMAPSAFGGRVSGSTGGVAVSLLAPGSAQGQRAYSDTDTTGPIRKIIGPLPAGANQTASWCAAACVADNACGAWTFTVTTSPPQGTNVLRADASVNHTGVTCALKGSGSRFVADVGSGCGGLGVSSNGAAGTTCTSGVVAWQLVAPGPPQPLLVSPRADGMVGLEIFVDQVMVEVFLNDAVGNGSAVATSTHNDPGVGATAVEIEAEGASVVVTGTLWELGLAVSPPPHCGH